MISRPERCWRRLVGGTAVVLVLAGGLSFPVPAVAQQPTGCLPPSLGLEDTILSAAEGYMITNFREVFGYARIRRIEGDWARVAVVPRTVTDTATLLLQRTDQGWQVVAGPGTSLFPPPSGAPPAVLEACPDR
jgi:hypothetical protein